MCFRYNFFEGCSKARACTLLLRGGAEQFIAETERSLHDAIMIVRRAKKNDSVVAGEIIRIAVSCLSSCLFHFFGQVFNTLFLQNEELFIKLRWNVHVASHFVDYVIVYYFV